LGDATVGRNVYEKFCHKYYVNGSENPVIAGSVLKNLAGYVLLDELLD
jgi:hypothetical protein